MPKSEDQNSLDRQSLRLLRLLARYPNSGVDFSRHAEKYYLEVKNRQVRFDVSVLDAAIAAKHVVLSDKQIRILDTGMLRMKLALHPDPSRGLSSREIGNVETTTIGGQSVVVNLEESPLSRLRNRKTRNGTAYIGEEEFLAGERLRKDFECGQLQPKISARWDCEVGGRNCSSSVDPSEISDFAMDARGRVENAIEKLGPELSGVALDICCFLKGAELVERERRWPPRSAKTHVENSTFSFGSSLRVCWRRHTQVNCCASMGNIGLQA